MSGGVDAGLIEELRAAVAGEVRCDRLSRAMYAVDASIYEIVPDAVVFPKTVADVSAVVRICARRGAPVTPRGAGTGLAGGCVNRGVQIDLSRFMNRVLAIDPEARTARVEPGVVLDELNARLRPHGLHFSPDVATASRATIGGMIGNNSAGAHSIVVGRTCDHVLGVDVVLSDGSLARWGRNVHTTEPDAQARANQSEPDAQARGNHRTLACAAGSDGAGSGGAAASQSLAHRCEQSVSAIVRDYSAEIEARFPKVFRRNGGYALDRLHADADRLNIEQLLVGSEGTLGVVVGATLNLLPLPKHQGLCVVHYRDLLDSLKSVPTILEHQPAAIELVDKLILDGTKDNPAMARRRGFLDGDPDAILIVEFFGDDAESVPQRLRKLADDLKSRSIGYAWRILTEPEQQADVWEVRKAGTGILMSRPGDTQPHDFVDDCAVEPARLHDYIARLREILADEGVDRTGYYAHASVGLLHVRPALNLKTREGVERLRRISDRVSKLVHEFEGAMTGEHGEGIVRSEWVPRMFGPKLVEAFRRVKTAFDPQGVFNPGKIVDPLPMDSNLRYGAGFTSQQPKTTLDFSSHGGMAGLAEMCSGIGECRKTLVGVMCPSYMATGDETNTTRARAGALREALSNRELLDGLSDPALNDVFDLCLSCKACKTECPTGADVAKLKTEWLHHKNKREGVPRRSRLIARSIELAALGSRFAPVSNWVMQSPITRAFMEHWFGLDRRVPPPTYANETFRQWFAGHTASRPRTGRDDAGGAASGAAARAEARGSSTQASVHPQSDPEAQASGLSSPRQVVYFVDTWTNYHTPNVGRAAVKVLEALGCEVIVPATACCGRPLISKGLLDEAKLLAQENVAILTPYAERGVPIIGTEPSCVSALVDELPQFVRTPAARRIAELVVTIESFVAEALAKNPEALRFKPGGPALLYHGHCHQKALIGTADAMRMLQACTGGSAKEIPSGCCGMAGAFGHEVEHYDVATAVGEQRLFPAIRERGEAQIAVSGFSCRHHIEHHTDARPRHAIEFVADMLA